MRRLLRRRKPRGRETLYLLIDDTHMVKGARKMPDVSKIWDHAEERFVRAHIVVSATVLFRDDTLPWWFELWWQRKQGGCPYREFTEPAADLIRCLRAPSRLKARVLFDGRYLLPTVVQACESREIT